MKTHGKTYTRTYSSWQNMKQRCLNSGPKNPVYNRYGGKGVTVCERWLTFDNFLSDMGERPVGKTLDRIDNARGYEPGNCRWSTPAEQALNRSRHITFVTHEGRTMCMSHWARELGLTKTCVYTRMRRGDTPRQALGLDPRKRRSLHPTRRPTREQFSREVDKIAERLK